MKPFVHPSQLGELIERFTGERVEPDELILQCQRVLKGWISEKLNGMDVDNIMVLGHYHIIGAKLSNSNYSEHLPGEFSLTRDMIPDKVDLTLLGHIHLHQEVYPGIVYTGDVERSDWGERNDTKGYVVVELDDNMKWRFEELPVREMV